MFDIVYNNVTTPPPTADALPRPRVEALLTRAAEQPLVTVTAGAGYGKTQAVSMFVNGRPARVAWLHLTRLDNYTHRFWSGFIYALSSPSPQLAARAQRLGFPDSLAKFDQFLHLLAAEIYDGEQYILVFDDFHLIEDEAIRGFVENLISARLENFCLILVGRTNPRLKPGDPPEASLTMEDLRFTLRETEEYLRLQGLEPGPSMLQQIQRSTEGWPLALYLLGLTMKNGAAPFSDPLSGALPLIFELIERELFSAYTPAIQDFLIELSLLDTFPLELIPQLTDMGAETVAELVRTNMFMRYDPRARHYHFHPLFADFLRARSSRLPQERRHTLYLKAGDWYNDQGMFVDAVSCYKQCGRHDKIWQAIWHTVPDRYPRQTAELLIGLLDELPPEFVAAQPLTRVVRASLQLNNLELDAAARDMLDLAVQYEALPHSRENQAILGEAYIVLGMIRLTQRDHSFVRYFQQAHVCLPRGSQRDYSNIKIVDSNGSMVLNDLNPQELEKMQSSLFAALPYAAQVMQGCGYGGEYLAAAETAYYRGDFAQAELNAFQAIYRARKIPQSDIVGSAYYLLMRISAAQGHHQASADYLGQLRAYVRDNVETGFLSMLDIAEGWFFIRMGETERVAGWLTDSALNSRIYPPISEGRDRLIRAQSFLEQGKYPELLAFLEQLDGLYRGKGLWFELSSALAMKTVALYYMGGSRLWLDALAEAYQAARGCRFIMQFVEQGHHMRAVTEAAKRAPKEHHIPLDWLDNIHAKSSTYAKRQSAARAEYHKRAPQVSTTLSKREREVLSSLGQGLTREEIAQSHEISINTVKSMLQNIYSKLGAINSADAVRIAMSAHIIQ